MKIAKKEYPLAAVRIRVMKRDKFRCTYCGASGNDVELEIDHIHPISKGGSNHMSNLTTACRVCNQAKSNKKARPNQMTNHSQSGLENLYIHILKDGKIHNQGIIVGCVDEMALIQRFSFLDGSQTDVVTLPKLTVMDGNKCKLYANRDAMIRYWLKESRERDREMGAQYTCSDEEYFRRDEMLYGKE